MTSKGIEGRKITIYPVTRIEGHGKVTIYLDENMNIDKVFFNVDQFRGFEKFLEGRYFEEAFIMTAKICGICPVSHILTAVKAGDMIMNIDVPPTGKMLRLLAHLGQYIQSHALHFFYLAAPDFLLGWGADPAIRNVVGLIQKYPDIAVKGVKLRKFGQTMIQYVAGARINPKNLIPGGVAAPLEPKYRDELLKQIDEMISYALDGLNYMKQYIEKNKSFFETCANFETKFLSLVNGDNWEIYDGRIRLIDKDGTILEEFDSTKYINYIGEHVEDWSYLKFPYFLKFGYPDGVYRAGPLARVNVAKHMPTEKASVELKYFKEMNNYKPVQPTFYYHYARLIEMLHSLEKAKELLEDERILDKEVYAKGKVERSEGIGVIEAPRGTLFHHYWVDEKGRILKCNFIVASGNNAWAMSKTVDMIARRFLDPKNIKEEALNLIEGGIRCYDPCLSCSTHAVGQMPLMLEIYDHKGELVNVIKRE